MASIGIGTVVGSKLQAKGWNLVQDLVNANTKYGIFTTDGEPFYLHPNGSTDSQSKPTVASTTIGGKVIDAMTGALATFQKSLMPNTSVEAGVIDLNYSFTSDITNAPLMNGQFFSYNKVIRPIEASINYTTTGTEKQRKFFENALKKAQLSFGLFTLHTGELSIPYVNITGFSIHRDQRNIQMYNVSIQVREVKFQLTASSSSLASVEGSFEMLGKPTAFNGSGTDSGVLQVTKASGSQVQSAQKIEAGGLY